MNFTIPETTLTPLLLGAALFAILVAFIVFLARYFLGSASPVNGETGYGRGYSNTRLEVMRGMGKETAEHWWLNADPPRDDYDRGVLDALKDSGFKSPVDDL